MSKILLVLLVALFVIKPEELPGVATALGRWVRRIKKLITAPEALLENYFYPDEKNKQNSNLVEKGLDP
jgi:Sec-independent protein translocase protein TatA